MRERVMTAENAAIEHGHIVIRDQLGVVRWTSNSDEDRQAPFDVNGVRLAGIQRLIQHRYGGPCDCDGDVHMYLSAAFNAIALGLQLKRRKAFPGNFKNWARKWCPVADPHDVNDLAARVIARPRRIRASTLGKLLGLSSAEHAALNIEAIYPADDDTFEARKKKEKSTRDRDAKEQKRRGDGRRVMTEIVGNSDKTFCARHRIAHRTFKRYKAKGADALADFLRSKGIQEVWPSDGASIVEDIPLLKRQGGATFTDRAGGGRKADQPASGLVINIDPDTFDRVLDQADQDRRRAASRAAARFKVMIFEKMAGQLRSPRSAA